MLDIIVIRIAEDIRDTTRQATGTHGILTSRNSGIRNAITLQVDIREGESLLETSFNEDTGKRKMKDVSTEVK